MADASPYSSLSQYAKERDALLERIVQEIESDTRVAAAWLAGSIGRGEADAWSDLDLHLAIDTDHLARFLAERETFYRRVGHPILIQEEKTSDSQAGARFQLVQYAGPIEVDWNIGPVDQAERPLAFRMLVERATVPIVRPAPLTAEERRTEASHWLTFFWAMAPIAVKYCGRGDPAVELIHLMTRAYIALWRLVSQPDGPNPILPSTNRILEPELDAQIPRIGPTIDPTRALDVIDGLCRNVQDLHPALQTLGAVVSPEVPTEVTKIRQIAEEVLQHGTISRRSYR
jgi:predicted nucleotidyltransferase